MKWLEKDGVNGKTIIRRFNTSPACPLELTCDDPNQEDAEPSWPRIMATLDPVPGAVITLLDDVAVSHAVSRHITLPVDCVEVIILPNAREFLLIRVQVERVVWTYGMVRWDLGLPFDMSVIVFSLYGKQLENKRKGEDVH